MGNKLCGREKDDGDPRRVSIRSLSLCSSCGNGLKKRAQSREVSWRESSIDTQRDSSQVYMGNNLISRRTNVAPSASLRHLLKLHIQSQLRFAGPAAAIKLPRGASLELWIDIHLVDFVNEAYSTWSLIEAQCEAKCCSIENMNQMAAGSRRSYTWKITDEDSPRIVTPVRYAHLTFDFATKAFEDSTIFPIDESLPYSTPLFMDTVSKISTDIFRLYAHIYHSHFAHILTLRCDQLLNDLFRRFVLFILEFRLIDTSELQPLNELIRNLFSVSSQSQADNLDDRPSSIKDYQEDDDSFLDQDEKEDPHTPTTPSTERAELSPASRAAADQEFFYDEHSSPTLVTPPDS